MCLSFLLSSKLVSQVWLTKLLQNRTHAADVLRNLHMMLTRGGLFNVLRKTPSRPAATTWADGHGPECGPRDAVHQLDLSVEDARTLLTLYFSAIIHDYDHRGVTYAFLIQDEDPIAVSHGSCSLMCHSSCLMCSSLLK